MIKLVTILVIALLPLSVVPAENNSAQNAAGSAPRSFSLGQNYPNPFNPATTIPYTVSTTGLVRLTFYDLLGKQVRVLINEEQTTGSFRVIWDGLNDSGHQAAAGVYFCKMTAAGFESMRRMILIR
jgi:hypothetical protein